MLAKQFVLKKAGLVNPAFFMFFIQRDAKYIISVFHLFH
nr:MAG TPA: hypothetical protein [Caudoviricetes sp.]